MIWRFPDFEDIQPASCGIICTRFSTIVLQAVHGAGPFWILGSGMHGEHHIPYVHLLSVVPENILKIIEYYSFTICGIPGAGRCIIKLSNIAIIPIYFPFIYQNMGCGRANSNVWDNFISFWININWPIVKIPNNIPGPNISSSKRICGLDIVLHCYSQN